MRTRQLSGPAVAVLGLVGVLLVGGLWQVVVTSGLLSKPGLPVPSTMIAQAGVLLGDAGFWSDIAATLGGWLLGVAIATVAGVVVGAAMGAFRPVFTALELPVEVFRTLPSVAVGPILVLVLRADTLPLALTVALSCVWPILFNTMYGVRGTDATAVQTARSFGMGPVGILLRIRLVSALPFAFTGIRVAASIGLIVMVSAELLIGDGRGIGGFILLATANATDLDGVYAATVLAGLLGVLVNIAFALADRLLFGWKKGLAQ